MTHQDMLSMPRPVKLTIADYVLLDRSGALAGYAKTELIDGTILFMNAAYSRHARAQKALYLLLDAACRSSSPELEVFFELSVSLSPASMPQPDIVIARNAPDNAALPGTDAALIVEISDTSVGFDLGAKATLYGAARIPEYWVADLGEGLLHQMWGPHDLGYSEYHRQSFCTPLEAVTLPIVIDLPEI